MPFLDAKALETDPDGLAFLREVLKPVRKGARSAGDLARRTGRVRVYSAKPAASGCVEHASDESSR